MAIQEGACRKFSRMLAIACIAPLLGTAGAAARAEAGFEPVHVDNWGFFQRNENGSDQWKYEPRLYVPYRFDNDITFTQRVDIPVIYTNDAGPGNPGGGFSAGIGDVFIEEMVESAEVATGFRLRASVRFVFPTGKQKPFGSSQYQWGPAGGFVYAMPNAFRGVTLTPYVRYLSGFNRQYDNVTETRKLELYPAATVELSERWSLLLYPDNPITYNEQNGTWFVPLDVMLARKVNSVFEFAFGGAVKLGHPSDPSYRYIVDARAIFHF